LTPEEVEYRLDRCERRGLLERKTIQYEGYRLTFEGYDALALHTFAERETIEGVGAPLGVGKESDVYEVRSYKPLALKFHREGYTDFREVNREREYTSDKEHVSWMYTARKAAEREYEALETLYPDVSVPQPIDHNRHAVVMERIDGVELGRAKLEDAQVVPVLDLVLDEMATAYDENSDELLARDVTNIVGYFQRKYPHHVESVDTDALAAAVAADEFDSVDEFAE
jgi:RIO kinase 2